MMIYGGKISVKTQSGWTGELYEQRGSNDDVAKKQRTVATNEGDTFVL